MSMAVNALGGVSGMVSEQRIPVVVEYFVRRPWWSLESFVCLCSRSSRFSPPNSLSCGVLSIYEKWSTCAGR